MNRFEKTGYVFSMLAGACDGATGILLLAAPLFTLKLMGISTLPAEPIYMQWIGAFVFSVGCSYFIPFLSRDVEARRRRATGIFEFTSFIRLVIATFTGISIFRGTLDASWIAVTFTDLFLAAAQITLLKLGVFKAAAA
jgi:hypothetical protein